MSKKNLVIIIAVILVLLGLFLFKSKPTNDPQITSQNSNGETKSSGTFIDKRDNHQYKWVKIGQQIWMTENLAFKPESGFSSYENNDQYVDTYGYLYNWQTAQTVCPQDWHLPSRDEWKELVGDISKDSASKLKEAGFEHWNKPNKGATNASGFTGLPAGGNMDGSFISLGKTGFYWSSTEINDTNAYALILESNSSDISWYSGTKTRDLSVRCVKNNNI